MRRLIPVISIFVLPLLGGLGGLGGCGSEGARASADDGGVVDGLVDDAGADPIDAADTGATSADVRADAGPDAGKPAHYATKVVSHTIGENGGYGEDELPDVVLGPPKGGGCCAGSTDVLSLGDGGEIVVGFDVAIVDGPGTDFLVFENAFQISGDPKKVLYELGEVSVSDDGVVWKTFACTAKAYPFGACAGWHPVLATTADPLDVNDPARAGGDPFDLADLGVTHARFVRVRDMLSKIPPGPRTGGFDLDAVAIVHEAAE